MAYYFVADVHAGLELNGIPTGSGERFIGWLDRVAADAEAIFLLGDIFDFWFEYKGKIPPGYDRLLQKLTELTERGIILHFFPGNHDMWTRDYLSRFCGIVMHPGRFYTEIAGKKIYMEHGDIQSIGSTGERFMQCLFRSRIVRWIGTSTVSFNRMIRFGKNWSSSNRDKHTEPHRFRREEEGIVRFARHYLQSKEVDIFIFGHLHDPVAYSLSDKTTLYVLGDWISGKKAVYGKLDASGFSLQTYEE